MILKKKIFPIITIIIKKMLQKNQISTNSSKIILPRLNKVLIKIKK